METQSYVYYEMKGRLTKKKPIGCKVVKSQKIKQKNKVLTIKTCGTRRKLR